jgi:hypothetical protein
MNATAGSNPADRRSEGAGLWDIRRAVSPVLATAIHDGHRVDALVASCLALDENGRLREEDPFTGRMIAGVPNRITCSVSRFCVDLNRPFDKSVYLKPSDAWDLVVWNRELDGGEIDHLRTMHQDYYTVLEAVLRGLERRHGRFVVLDVHSYNHRRAGPHAPPSDPQSAPDINIGTFSMDRHRWGHVVDAFTEFCRSHPINGHFLDVRENVAFEGRGEQTRFIHERFPKTGCAIAVEFKKIFMDEWSGVPDDACIAEITGLIAAAVHVLETALDARP